MQLRVKDKPPRVHLANGEVVVSQTVVKLQVKLANGLTMQLLFRVVPYLSCPVILRTPWVFEFDPQINKNKF